ncbi:MAG: hypothetical protein WBE31_20760, partial [Candidatus Sulfotelmatobacter sp.]
LHRPGKYRHKFEIKVVGDFGPNQPTTEINPSSQKHTLVNGEHHRRGDRVEWHGTASGAAAIEA